MGEALVKGHRIEIRGIVHVDARRKDFGFEQGGGQRRSLQLLDRVEQRVGAAAAFDDSLPGRGEASEYPLIDRFDFTDDWFFATQVAVRAEWLGAKVLDMPVQWTDDPDNSKSGARLVIRLRNEKIAKDIGPIDDPSSRRTMVSCAM